MVGISSALWSQEPCPLGPFVVIRGYSTSNNNPNGKPKRLPKEAKLRLSEQLRANTQLNETLTGLILSDGHIELMGNNARFKLHLKDRDFTYHVWNLFNDFDIVGAEPRTVNHSFKQTGKSSTSYYFCTFSLPYFSEQHDKWYTFNKSTGRYVKGVPNNIADILTARAFAYFLCGDSSYHQVWGYMYLYTNSFTLDEVKLIIKALKSNFGIDSSVNTANKLKEQYRVYIPKRMVPVVQSVVKPYIHPSFLYRIGLANNDGENTSDSSES